jgi:hypothetical protein
LPEKDKKRKRRKQQSRSNKISGRDEGEIGKVKKDRRERERGNAWLRIGKISGKRLVLTSYSDTWREGEREEHEKGFFS